MRAAMSGLPYVPLNYRLTDAQVDALLDRITPVYLIAKDGHVQNHGRDLLSLVERSDRPRRRRRGRQIPSDLFAER